MEDKDVRNILGQCGKDGQTLSAPNFKSNENILFPRARETVQ